MNRTIFAAMLGSSLKDKITLFYSLVFPLALLIGLGLYFDTADYRERLLTGVTALGALFWGVQGIAFQVYQQRNRGVYKLLRMTPYSVLAFILTVTLARTCVGMGINAIILVTGMAVFGISISPAGLLVFMLLLLAGTLCFTALGFLIANLASNEGQINALANMLQLPMIFASGAFYSLEGAPAWVIHAGQAFPFSHLVNGLSASISGQFSETWLPLLLLALFTCIIVGLAAATFRWDSGSLRLSTKRQRAN